LINFRIVGLPVLHIDNLTIDFASNKVVKQISLDIEPGEILAIVGESGSGKSVTALAIMQLLSKQAKIEGKIFFNGVDLLGLKEDKINAIRGKDIAMIFQEPMTSLNPVLTCGSQVQEAIQLHKKISSKEAKQQTIELFDKVQLPDPSNIYDRYPHQLSGGQKQRVMIAMAMSCSPSLLIADEPTTALDVTVQAAILNLIKDLQKQTGMAVILITHDLGVAADIADKIAVMYKGEIVEYGVAAAVLKAPRHEYTKALLECRIDDRGQMTDDSKVNSLTDAEPLSTVNRQLSTFLRVENLNVIFGKQAPYFKAVDDVSFDIYKNEIVGLVGESGCGKTTLGRAIIQMIKASSGKIILDGVELSSLNEKQLRPLRKNFQIIFQDPYASLNPRMIIGKAIEEPMKVHGILNSDIQRKEKVVQLLERVGLDASAYNQYPHQFSGGQRQRICIARALALNPSFLIFDESVSALDMLIQAQILTLLNDLKKEFGFTAIFISHDLSVVHQISDRIMVMYKGKIIETGTADEIYFSPTQPYTKQLLEAMPGKRLMDNGIIG
jgi:peptide/nickel transport system ATP-binding protein